MASGHRDVSQGNPYFPSSAISSEWAWGALQFGFGVEDGAVSRMLTLTVSHKGCLRPSAPEIRHRRNEGSIILGVAWWRVL